METKSFDLKKFLMKYVMYIFLVLMCIILAIASDKFLTVTNLMTIIKQISIQSIVAIGMQPIRILDYSTRLPLIKECWVHYYSIDGTRHLKLIIAEDY